MWKILQQKKPDDFVIATGKQYSVRDFTNIAAKKLGIKLKWVGKGLQEKAINIETNSVVIEVNKKYFRPTEVASLKGNITKTKKILKWKPKISFKKLVEEMVDKDLKDQERFI